MNIAIVAVAYNRCNSLNRLLDSLKCAYYDNKTTLIISVDKSNSDIIEKFADDYHWPHGEKIVDKHDKNLGLRPHMMSLGKWFDYYDAIVVLEDDLVVSPNFFCYTKHAVTKYHDNPNIAGISLYGMAINYQNGQLYEPMKDEHDAYFMNCAMSWGEVWMRDSWQRFYDWYLLHQDFPILPHLPRTICLWNEKSWLKYHIRYCIEENKFFVFPYTSLTTNFGDAGEHSTGGGDTVFQVALQKGKKMEYSLPDFREDAICYDGFFENKSLYSILGFSPDELCLDLYGEWHNRLKKRYWLTAEVANYRIIRSFGLNYRPIEENVIMDNSGHQLFLYDTNFIEKNENVANNAVIRYHYRLGNMASLIKTYGMVNLWRDFTYKLKEKIKK